MLTAEEMEPAGHVHVNAGRRGPAASPPPSRPRWPYWLGRRHPGRTGIPVLAPRRQRIATPPPQGARRPDRLDPDCGRLAAAGRQRLLAVPHRLADRMPAVPVDQQQRAAEPSGLGQPRHHGGAEAFHRVLDPPGVHATGSAAAPPRCPAAPPARRPGPGSARRSPCPPPGAPRRCAGARPSARCGSAPRAIPRTTQARPRRSRRWRTATAPGCRPCSRPPGGPRS